MITVLVSWIYMTFLCTLTGIAAGEVIRRINGPAVEIRGGAEAEFTCVLPGNGNHSYYRLYGIL